MQTLSLVFLVLLSVSTAHSQQTVAQFINDNNVLNYALTLEYLEAELYAQGLAKFGTAANYTAAGFPAGTYEVISLIATQEAGHATALSNLLTLRGWPPVNKCTYSFGNAFNDVNSFVNTLATVENLGTGAYVGASAGLTNAQLLTVAAGIATVEARHTALLQTITNTSYAAPFPNDVENVFNSSFVFSQAKGYISSCTPNSLAVNYSPTGTVSVISSDPNTFNFKDSASVRGNNSVLDQNAGLYSNTAAGNAAKVNDFAVLNYALTLEHLEDYFYRNNKDSYTEEAILAAQPNANASLISQSIALIGSHESFHVSYLQTVLGANATQPCSYNFTSLGLPDNSTDFSQFITVAGALEQTGVSAYVGAIRLLVNPFVAQAAASIATIEARHAAYVRNVILSGGQIYGPGAQVNFDASSIQNLTLNANSGAYNDGGQSPTQVATFLTSNGILSNCPPSNPPFYGVGNFQATAQDFFGDNAAAVDARPTVNGTTSTTRSNNSSSSSTTNPNTPPRTTGSSSSLTICFAVLAFSLALMF